MVPVGSGLGIKELQSNQGQDERRQRLSESLRCYCRGKLYGYCLLHSEPNVRLAELSLGGVMRLRSISDGLKRVPLILALSGLGAITLWYFTIHTPPISRRTLRIGFEQVPPVQIRTDSGFSGLAVETVTEAAKRAGLSLLWVETGTSSEEALRRVWWTSGQS